MNLGLARRTVRREILLLKIFEHQPAPQRLPDVQFCGTLILPEEVYFCVSQYYITFA